MKSFWFSPLGSPFFLLLCFFLLAPLFALAGSSCLPSSCSAGSASDPPSESPSSPDSLSSAESLSDSSTPSASPSWLSAAASEPLPTSASASLLSGCWLPASSSESASSCREACSATASADASEPSLSASSSCEKQHLSHLHSYLSFNGETINNRYKGSTNVSWLFDRWQEFSDIHKFGTHPLCGQLDKVYVVSGKAVIQRFEILHSCAHRSTTSDACFPNFHDFMESMSIQCLLLWRIASPPGCYSRGSLQHQEAVCARQTAFCEAQFYVLHAPGQSLGVRVPEGMPLAHSPYWRPCQMPQGQQPPLPSQNRRLLQQLHQQLRPQFRQDRLQASWEMLLACSPQFFCLSQALSEK